ncbi:hypothetical protein [Microbispora sp. GKU 823]|uniref:hypothetical protein n=1 Tax=Microbispora sp. GKU 823 TaxID=1652100 RepID=UPI0021190691|nr:hypothetical protein [Microbispora sp. GKU 823]
MLATGVDDGLAEGLGEGLADGLDEGLADGLGEPVTPPVQAVPLSVKLAGAGLAPFQVPLKPKDVLAPVASVPL